MASRGVRIRVKSLHMFGFGDSDFVGGEFAVNIFLGDTGICGPDSFLLLIVLDFIVNVNVGMIFLGHGMHGQLQLFFGMIDFIFQHIQCSF